MKKFFLALVAMISLLCTSCHKDHSTSNVTVDVTNVDSIMCADYATVCLAQYDSVVKVSFYESEITLDKSIKDENPQPVIVRNICQAGDTCWEFTHIASFTENVVKYNDYWMEDNNIDLDSVKVSLDSAIILLNRTNIVTPNTKKVVLRQPLNPKYKDPLYIFGKTVSVDAKTGKVEYFK